VRRLRIGLPVAAAMAVVALFAATRLSLPDGLDLSAASLSVTPSSIIMERPHLKGFDKRNREYSVIAERAIQSLTDPDAVGLERIVATLGSEAEGVTVITAESGDYDKGESRLRLHGPITIESADGISVAMTEADVDFAAGTVQSGNPVKVSQGGQTTTAQSISVTGSGDVIRLAGKVRTIYLPARRTPDAAARPEEQVSR
jgi:lipopolysaccharide export system protein LptC